MALTVDLKKSEKFIIGDTVIINESHNRKFEGGARLQILGGAPGKRHHAGAGGQFALQTHIPPRAIDVPDARS